MSASETTELSKGEQFVEKLEPPSDTRSSIREPLNLVFQLVYLLIMFVPLIILVTFKNLLHSKPKSVRDKVVLVTGSARGLGRGFAEKFAQLGSKVACVDLNEAENAITVAQINNKYPGRALAYRCNVASSTDIANVKVAVKKDLGDVNILVHNAGIVCGMPITQFEEAFIHDVVAVNLTSHFLMIREFLPDMMERNEGHLVAVASVAGFIGSLNGTLYCATKHGIIGLMESLHYELKERKNNKVQTSVVCPYFVNTSASYNKMWDIRLPELSIEETVAAGVKGVLRNERIITIPSIYYYGTHLMKLLPDKINDILRDIIYVKINMSNFVHRELLSTGSFQSRFKHSKQI